MFAPGILQVQAEFHSTNDLLVSFVVSVYVLGFAFGPLIFAPLSEVYGRLPLYTACNFLFVAFTIACAEATTMDMLIAMRFLAGAVAACPLSLGGGTIVDVIEPERRGLAIALFSFGPIVGPVIGPTGGGFLTQAKGWRWVFWLLTIVVSAKDD